MLVGCMPLGGTWDDRPHEPARVDVTLALIDTAIEAGLTAFDHADIYGAGAAHGCEARFAEALQLTPAQRSEITLQTKAGIVKAFRCAVGDQVATIEAMKMEAAIAAPVAGTIKRVVLQGTTQLEGGDLVVVIDPA